MTKTRKILAMLLAALFVLGMSTAALAKDVNVGGGTGSITITNAEPTTKYSLYRLFDATLNTAQTGTTYIATKSLGTAGEAFFEVDSNNVVTPKSTLTSDVLQGNAFITWAKSYGTLVGTADQTTTDGSLKFNNIPFGYYFISTKAPNQQGVDEDGALLTVDSANPSANVLDKNTVIGPGPNGGKSIADGQGQTASAAAAKLDDPVSFVIDIAAKNYNVDKKVYQYIIYDQIDTGLTYDLSSVEAFVNNSKVTTGVTTTWYTAFDFAAGTGTEATATTPAKDIVAFKTVVNWTADGTAAGNFRFRSSETLEVRYTAKLDSEKASSIDYQGNPANNKARFAWMEEDKTGEQPYDPQGTGGTLTSGTYTTEIEITKTDGTSALQGAEFTLTGESGDVVYTQGTRFVADNTNGTYYELKDGTYTTTSPLAANVNKAVYVDATGASKFKQETFTEVQGSGKTSTTIKSFVGADGKAKFSGLGEGTYTITESVVPAGYNKADDITFTVKFDATAKKFYIEGTTSPVTPNESGTPAATLAVTIVNNSGAELPSTGGIGTTIFYAAGSILLLGAAVLMITRRRVTNEK